MIRHRAGSLVLPLVFLLPAASTLRAQDFEGVFTARVRNMPVGGEMKTYVKGVRYRMEITMPQGAMAIIMDPVAGETYMVMNAQSMYMVMKMADAERMADSVLRQNPNPPDLKVTATGKKEQVAGHECEFYRTEVAKPAMAMEVCLAKGLGAFRSGGSLFGGPPTPGRPSAAVPEWAKELVRQDGFPLKVVDDKGAVVWEVVSIERKSLEASLFVPPQGFRRMEMPAFGRPPQN
jgi:hypothetical protein